MWDAIYELLPDEDIDTQSGDLLLLITLSDCDVNVAVRDRVETLAVNMPGSSDLRFIFADSEQHCVQLSALSILPEDLPTAVFFARGEERERCHSVDDALDLAQEIVELYTR